MDLHYYRKLTLALSKEKGIGNIVFKKMMEEFGWDIKKLTDKTVVNNLQRNLKESIYNVIEKIDSNESNSSVLEKDLEKNGIMYKCIWEKDYPELLKQTYDPPMIMYYVGLWNTEIFQNCITIVGSRKITDYGKKITKQLSYDLAKNEVTIVSGMAIGVDKAAHEAAILAKGKTIGVLASSPNKPSPLVNSDIYKSILESGGLIISENGPDISIKPGLFASRNRIVAGLSKGTVVTEAAEKSGSLITANIAFDNNRELFAVPGNIDRKMSVGCNTLIGDGKAKLVAKANDILLEYGLKQRDNSVEPKKTIHLKDNWRGVFEALSVQPMNVDELSRNLNSDVAKISIILSEMELESIVERLGNGKYQIS